MLTRRFLLAAVPVWLSAAPARAFARSTGAARSEPIALVVIHSTGGPTCDPKSQQAVWVGAGTLDENLRNIQAHPVLGIHYMIDRDGTTRSSVPESQVAHHVYRFSGRSIAVELINDGDGVDPFPETQLNALVALLLDIKERRGVKRSGVVRHSDLDLGRLPCDRSKRRKVDPGSAFPYQLVLDRVFPP